MPSRHIYETYEPLSRHLTTRTAVPAPNYVMFEAEPRLQKALTIAGSAYLAWLGIEMILQTLPPGGTGESRPDNPLPRTWLGIALFQFANPKGWVLTLTATAAVTQNGWSTFAALAAIFAVLSGFCLAIWSFAGSIVGTLPVGERSRRWFDRALGGMLIVSAGLLMTR